MFTDWELVLIDDGRVMTAPIVSLNSTILASIVRHNERKGLACRLNEAVRLSRGKLIARMDADDIAIRSGSRSRRISAVQSGIDLVASKALVFRGEGKFWVTVPPVTGDETSSRLLTKGFVFPHPTWCGRAAWFREHSMMKSEC